MKIKIMSGVPGSGKSTYVQTEMAKINAVREPYRGPYTCKFSADDYFVRLGDGTYKFDPSKLGEAHGECLRDYSEFVAYNNATFENDTVFVDNTNTTAIEIAPYASLALAYSHDLEIITFMAGSPVVVSPSEADSQLSADLKLASERNTHGVPLKSIERMHANLMHRRLPGYWNQTVKPFSR